MNERPLRLNYAMRSVLLCGVISLVGCDVFDDPKVDDAIDKAEDALDKAGKGARKGYDKAEREVRRGAAKAGREAKRGYAKAERGARRGYAKAEAGVRKGADKAGDALEHAGERAKDGYDRARDRVTAIDWVQAFDATKDGLAQAGDALTPDDGPAPADAWWTRGPEAVSCKKMRCTVAPWFVSAARSNPTRLMGDVKILTAHDDSGWLLDDVKRGTAAYAMGFRAGDVVRTVDGHPLTDGLARLEVLAALRSKPEVTTTFVRAGESKPVTLTVVFEST
ncbi:MAG: hypothetical protein AAGA54_04610 [Myxococcota bacterium]